MARTVEEFMCPSCGKKSKLCDFRYGVIKSTLCTFCLEVYLRDTLNPFVKSEIERQLHGKESKGVENYEN